MAEQRIFCVRERAFSDAGLDGDGRDLKRFHKIVAAAGADSAFICSGACFIPGDPADTPGKHFVCIIEPSFAPVIPVDQVSAGMKGDTAAGLPSAGRIQEGPGLPFAFRRRTFISGKGGKQSPCVFLPPGAEVPVDIHPAGVGFPTAEI